MNCQEFWETYCDKARRHSEEEHRHLHECRPCASTVSAQRGLIQGLRGLAAETRSIQANQRVENRLLVAFRENSGYVSEPRRRRWVPVLTWAAAAAVLLMLGVFLTRERDPEPVRRANPRVELAVFEAPQSSVTLAGFGGDFVRLPNVADIDVNEELNLVRLEMSGSALIALGVPLGVERATESLQADLILGADGMARAVRLDEE
jgi:hypothetical protein